MSFRSKVRERWIVMVSGSKAVGWWALYIAGIMIGFVMGGFFQSLILGYPLAAGTIYFVVILTVSVVVCYYTNIKNFPGFFILAFSVLVSSIFTLLTAVCGWAIYPLISAIVLEKIEESVKKGQGTVLSS